MKLIKPEPAVIVIFGITGDLVKRKLFPALYDLIKDDLLHEKTTILGITRQNISSDDILTELIDDRPGYDKSAILFLKDRFNVQTMDVDSISDYHQLKEKLNIIEEAAGMCLNRLYYLSVPPKALDNIVGHLGKSGLNEKCPHNHGESRLLIEKPFGYNLKSAEQLIEEIGNYFEENQVFRIDHYLAKDTVQNILNFRFSNAIFESIWDRRHISRIDITSTEEINIEGRANFYEQTGAVRDFIQSHLIQLMAIITMEEPKSFSSEDIHKSKLTLLKAAEKIKLQDVDKYALRGQYQTYKKEVNNPTSNTETFAAISVTLDTPRWYGVPIIIKTGKALSKKETSVRVIFKRSDREEQVTQHNSLLFRIQPNEGIQVELVVKKPGIDTELEIVEMDFTYSNVFKDVRQTDAYERVLVDAIRGDHTLFATSKEIIASWEIVDCLLDKWLDNDDGLQIYPDNSSGPSELPDWLKPYYKL